MNSGSFVCSWSGGKDSCYALMCAMDNGFTPAVLLTVLNEEGMISRSHGIPAAVLEAQARAAKLPIHLVSSSWAAYENNFVQALRSLKSSPELSYAVFGDIDLQAHRDWEEKVCADAGLFALLPLWKQDRKELVGRMLGAGIETMIVSCNTAMGERFLGKKLSSALVEELESLGIDACGENGEFHTLVLDCPLFNKRVPAIVTRTMLHDNYWFAELALT